MASSFTEFQGRGFFTRDGTLYFWLCLLVREVDLLEEKPEWLIKARDHWASLRDWEGTGCMDASLDVFLVDQMRANAMEALICDALEYLHGRGPILTRDFLNELTSATPGACFLRDVETRDFTRVGLALLSLIRGELDSNEGSAMIVQDRRFDNFPIGCLVRD